MLTALSSFSLTVVPFTGGPGLAVHHADGPLRPFLLLPDGGGDSRDWHDVALRLNQVGHAVAAVDLGDAGPDRDVDGAADDVAHLIETLDLRGPRAPMVAGHGRGGAVALSLAARRGGVAAVACVDGGWTRSGGEPEDAGPDPRAWFPLVGVPTLLCPAGPGPGEPGEGGEVADAVRRLPGDGTRVSWYRSTGHDVPAAAPARLTEDLLRLAGRAEPGPADPQPLRERPGDLPGYLKLLDDGRPGDPGR